MRRRIKTLELSPEEIGLCGSCRIAAVERATIDLAHPKDRQQPPTEVGYYVASRTREEMADGPLLEAIIGHWDAIENGTHRVRDASFAEDACPVARPKAARNMVTLRGPPHRPLQSARLPRQNPGAIPALPGDAP